MWLMLSRPPPFQNVGGSWPPYPPPAGLTSMTLLSSLSVKRSSHAYKSDSVHGLPHATCAERLDSGLTSKFGANMAQYFVNGRCTGIACIVQLHACRIECHANYSATYVASRRNRPDVAIRRRANACMPTSAGATWYIEIRGRTYV